MSAAGCQAAAIPESPPAFFGPDAMRETCQRAPAPIPGVMAGVFILYLFL